MYVFWQKILAQLSVAPRWQYTLGYFKVKENITVDYLRLPFSKQTALFFSFRPLVIVTPRTNMVCRVYMSE